MSNIAHFVQFRGADDVIILQRPEDISTFMIGKRLARPGKPGGTVVYALLTNNNRVELVGETLDSVMEKMTVAYLGRPLIFNELGIVPEAEVEPKEEVDA